MGGGVNENGTSNENEIIQQEGPTDELDPILVDKNDKSPKAENENDELLEPTSEETDMCCICLGTMENAGKPDKCMHMFCFSCLKKWCEKHSSCPLCVTPFTAIQHNLRGEGIYDNYQLLSPYYNRALALSISSQSEIESSHERTQDDRQWEVDFAVYRLWSLTDYDDNVLWRLGYYDMTIPRTERGFRRCVYRRRLWVIPPPVGQLRTSTPEYYKENPGELERLKIWLTRELKAFQIDINLVNNFMTWLKTYHISDRLFYHRVYQFLITNTDHFIHELYCFASSTIDDMLTYDNTVQYTMKRGRQSFASNLWDTPMLDDGELVGLQALFGEGDVTLWEEQEEEHGVFQIQSAVRYRIILYNNYGTANEIFEDIRGYFDPEQYTFSRMVWFATFDCFIFGFLTFFFYYYTQFFSSNRQTNEENAVESLM